ncbi:MAG: FAD-binding oxidoreductase [Chitinophagaceae bacterium]|nr:FAD-binding oxidoreductase [Chitinophagaceae bacterium]
MQVSIWEKESFYAPKDVVIAGSGLVGLWCAYYLKKHYPKVSITIIDRGIIPTGASTRNAGFACFGSATELLEDTASMGEEKMLELVEMRWLGLERIRKVFKDKPIDFEIAGGYELITEQDEIQKKELNARLNVLNSVLGKVINKKNIFRLSDKKIKNFGFHQVTHLIENKLEGFLHSGKLCQYLLQLVQAAGVTVLNSIEITGHEQIGEHVVLYTNQQIHITCSKLLVCTNGFAKQLLPELDLVAARGQILVTSEIPNLKFTGTFHYDGGYYYFRNLGKRVLVGGARNKALEEETSSEMITTEKIQKELEYFLSKYILPGEEFLVTDRWSGIMGMGPEKMPIVQKISDNIFCAVRLGGMGVALSPVIAEKMAHMMFR